MRSDVYPEKASSSRRVSIDCGHIVLHLYFNNRSGFIFGVELWKNPKYTHRLDLSYTKYNNLWRNSLISLMLVSFLHILFWNESENELLKCEIMTKHFNPSHQLPSRDKSTICFLIYLSWESTISKSILLNWIYCTFETFAIDSWSNSVDWNSRVCNRPRSIVSFMAQSRPRPIRLISSDKA